MRCGHVDDCLALHVGGDGDIHEAEDGRCDVAYFQIVSFAGVRAVVEDKDTVLGVGWHRLARCRFQGLWMARWPIVPTERQCRSPK